MTNQEEPHIAGDLSGSKPKPFLSVRSKRKMYKMMSFIFSVILIPLIMTILLSAYEDETNAWVRHLFAGKKKETYTETIKRLAASGNLPDYRCGPIGTAIQEVINRCGKPVKRTDVYEIDGSNSSLFYLDGNSKLIGLDFQNEKLKSIMIQARKNESLLISEVKRVFGPPSETNEGKSDMSDLETYYQYNLNSYHVTFSYSSKTNKLDRFTLETTSNFPYDGRPRTQFVTAAHPVGSDKRISPEGGLSAAKQLKQWISRGDLGNYDCGPLGTSLQQVAAGTCGDYENNVSSRIVSDQEKGLGFRFKDREIQLKFFKDRLTSISVRETEQPLPITKENIERVFGKPDRDKSSFDILDGKFVSYKLNDKKADFFFNDKGELDYIWLRKSGLYDDEFGTLLPQNE